VTRIAAIFQRVSADQVRRDQLYEAERLQVEHQAAAELHAGLAGIYRIRVERLRKELAAESATPVLKAVK
jgi:hypothetical protein